MVGFREEDFLLFYRNITKLIFKYCKNNLTPHLRVRFSKALVLAYPNPNIPYIMDADATNLAIGAVLSQVQDGEEKVIMYGSKAFYYSQR